MSAAEQGRFVTPPASLLARLSPFDYGRHHGVKGAHVKVFSEVCLRLDVTLLLRATNPRSIAYMHQRGYAAKPIDCKAKTADRDVPQGRQWIECGGLVADPHVVGVQAFGSKKLKKALESWKSFEDSLRKRRLGNGVVVYERAEHKGFYAVDIAEASTLNRHHGCLMVSDQSPPADFDPRKSHIRTWMARHMRYLHGDYDLYGVIDNAAAAAAAAGPGKVHEEAVRKIRLLGHDNYVSSLSLQVQQALNEGFSDELVKHGEQSAYEHTASDVYLFLASGAPSSSSRKAPSATPAARCRAGSRTSTATSSRPATSAATASRRVRRSSRRRRSAAARDNRVFRTGASCSRAGSAGDRGAPGRPRARSAHPTHPPLFRLHMAQYVLSKQLPALGGLRSSHSRRAM